MLTVLLLLSNYKMKSVPVVGEAKIDNIITQSAVIHMLAECAGLHWFENFGTKKLTDIGLPLMSSKQVVKVCTPFFCIEQNEMLLTVAFYTSKI